MFVEIERRNPGIVAHLLRKELKELMDRDPWIRKSVKAVITSHDRLLIIVENTLDSVKVLDSIIELIGKFFNDYEIKKVGRG
ncbi:MAG: hypothetical protein QXG81_06820 [Ignisphaera sp.]